ncbi:MAG TPA: tRNA uridine-5-carboxymethylaminomethyl(34) synthesis GTPase MnmE [Rhodocyclaceae bacterium]|nr:tRNA uridine-5-carboxymethylaminomethyl(34) synthesis GTPase MnmE [Rhodocyclaceae bacterium]
MGTRPSLLEAIAAVATPPGRGGIGVVRISGTQLGLTALALLGRVPEPRRATLARFRAGDGSVIDQGIAVYYPAPHSYTGEDVLELHGHGGPVVLQMLLKRCLELGARPAEPGEFTRRAYLNDKLDLAQAESVADLIEASTTAAARSAVRSLTGEFSGRIHALVDRLVELRTLVEATLDFPDEAVDFLKSADAAGRLEGIRADLEAIASQARRGSLLRSGLQVVLAGQPNVGKSSLLNRLAGEERAIVTEVAGTTRDALRESIQIEGIPLHVIDTAGLRETEDRVERIGISRAWQEIERSDVVLLLVDARHGVTEADRAILARLPSGIRRVVVYNKIDLTPLAAHRRQREGEVAIYLSAGTGAGVELLHAELLAIAGWHGGEEDVFMARERHLQALDEAGLRLEAASGESARLELFAEELRLAQESLATITGEFTADDLLGEVFSRFCIGK